MKTNRNPSDSIRSLTSDSQLLQDYLKSAGILVSTQDDGVSKVAAFRNHEGEAEAIVIDPTGGLFHVCREKLSDSGWNMYGIGAGFQMIAAVDRATAWAVGNNGGLWRSDHGRWTRTETLPNGNRATLVSAGTDGTIWASDGEGALFARNPATAGNIPAISSSAAPVLLTDSEQLLNLFCLDIGGRLWTARQLAAGDSWGGWQKLGSPSAAVGLTSIAIAGNQDGRLQVFALGADGLAHTIWQQSPGGDWSAWGMLAAANPAISALAVAQDRDGRLEVFALRQPDSAGNIVLTHTWQTAPNGGWNSWQDWPLPSSGQGMTSLAAIRDQEGCLAVVVLGAAGQTAQAARQTSPGIGWSDWLGIGAPSVALSQPALMMNRDGSLEIFALGSDGNLWHQWQSGATWGSGWFSLGSPGPGPSGLALGQNQDGRLEAFCPVAGGLSHIWQETAGGGWSSWASLGAPPAQSLAAISVTLNQAGALEAVVVGATNVAWRIVQQPSSPTAWSGWLADWSAWSLLAGAPQLIGMPSGAGANFWAIEAGGGLVSWNGAAWSNLALPGGLSAAQLTVDADGTVWVLAGDAAGSFFKIVGGVISALPDGLPGAASLGAGGGSTVWATAAAGNAAYRLCTYQSNGWQTAASPPISNMDWNNYPQVSVGRDGGAWLLDGSGNAWAPGAMDWAAKGKSVSFQSLAAANVNNEATADQDNDAAWGVTAAGAFRRSFGNGWAEPYAALPNGAAAAGVSVGRDGSVWAIDAEGGLYRQAPSNAAPAPAIDGPWTLAAGRNGSGGSYLFGIDTNHQPWVASRGAGPNDWLGWSALASPEPLAMLITGFDQNQVTDEVFCLTSGGQALHAWEDATAPTGWSQLTTLGASGQPPNINLDWLASGADATSLLHVFGLGVDNSVWVIRQQSGSSTGWTDWSAMPAFTGGAITFLGTGNEPGGEIEVVALDDTGIAWHSWQDAQAASGWSDWAVLGPSGQPAGIGLTALTTANRPGGPLYVFAIGGDGNVYAINGDSSSPTGWSAWYPLGSIAGVTPQSLQAGAGAGGMFFLFLQGSDGAIYADSLPYGSNAWSGWTPLGASGTSGIALQSLTAAPDAGGVMRVLAVGGGSIWQTYPLPGAATGWADWGRLCGPQSWTGLDIGGLRQAPVGEVGNLWAVFADGSVRQSPDGANWTAVPLPGTGAAQAAVSVSDGIDGIVWAVTASQCYRYDKSSGSWAEAGAGDFARAPVGLRGDLWAVDQSGGVLRSGDGGATWTPDTSLPEPARQLSMCADGSVWALDAQGTSWLASRWQRVMRPTGMPGFDGTPPASEVAAGVDENGTRYVFAVINQQLYYSYELGRHAWPEFINLGSTQVSGIGLTTQQDTGGLIVYAAPRAGGIPYAAKVPGQQYEFALSDCSMGISGISGPFSHIAIALMDFTSIELAAIDGDNWCWFCAGSGKLYTATTPAGPSTATLEEFGSQGPAAVSQLLRLPWPRTVSAPYCAVLDGSNQIWLCGAGGFAVPLTGQGTPIPNGVSTVAALLQADAWTPPQPRFYALAGGTLAGSDPTLWMLSWSNLFEPPYVASAWGGWSPLGGDYAGLCNGPSLTAADTLFTVDAATDSLDALRQNPMTGKWTDGLVKRPSQSGDDIVSVPMYQSEITIRDGNGIPEPKVAVTIFAETPTEAWINNVLHRLDPVHGATVPTNDLGKLNIKTLANGLHAARLSFQAAGLGGCGAIPGRFGSAGVSLSPSEHVYDFLSGSGSLPVGGGPSTTLTPGALQRLKPSLSSTNAQTVVTDFKTITQMPGTQMPGRTIARPASPMVRETALGAPPGGFFSDLWHDVKHVGESIAHAVEKGVVSAAIDVAGDVVKLTLYIGGQLVTAFDMVIHTVEDAVRAIEIIVKKFIADIEEFVEWLMLLFDWRKILETQRALRNWIVQAVPVLQEKMTTVEAQVNSTFNSVRSDIKAKFASITSSGNIAGYSTFGDLPTSVSSPGHVAGARLTGSLGSAQPIAGTSSVHHNWFLTKVLDHITPSFAVPAISGVDAASFIDALNLQSTIAQIQQMAQDLINFLTTAFKDPGELKSKGIVDLLNAGEALLFGIFDLIEGLIDAFLTLIQQIFAGLLDVLHQTIDIPVIDDLFKFLTGEDMSALNLYTLLTAVPLYLFYEAAFGGMPFFGAGAEGVPGAEMSTAEALGNTFLVLGIICWFVTGLSNLLTLVATPDMTDIHDIVPFLGMFNVIVAISMQLAGWPDPNGFPFVSGQTWSAALPFVWGNYALFWIPPLINLLALGKKLPLDAKEAINTIVGWMAMATGIVAAILGRTKDPQIVSPAEVGCLVTRPISASLSFLLLSVVRNKIWNASDFFVDTAALVFVSDLITTLAAPILHDIGAHEPAAAPPESPA